MRRLLVAAAWLALALPQAFAATVTQDPAGDEAILGLVPLAPATCRDPLVDLRQVDAGSNESSWWVRVAVDDAAAPPSCGNGALVLDRGIASTTLVLSGAHGGTLPGNVTIFWWADHSGGSWCGMGVEVTHGQYRCAWSWDDGTLLLQGPMRGLTFRNQPWDLHGTTFDEVRVESWSHVGVRAPYCFPDPNGCIIIVDDMPAGTLTL